jgi:S-(hydroxymethyl)glutathione dehydrogenase/alcohol dehydrogenase
MTDSIPVRAAVLDRPGVATRIEELSLDAPGPGEVRVRMLASGDCHSDLHVRDGEWERPGPLVLGHEGSATVEVVGPGVTSVRPGQLVALTWYAPCRRCSACLAGREWLCTGSSSVRHRLPDGRTPLRRGDGSEVLPYLGIGTFAAGATVAAEATIPLPDGIAPEVAALIGCCVATGVGAVTKTAQVEAGAGVVVIGLGGVGLSCVMGAVLAGAGRIVAVDRVPAKLERARDLGATDTVLAGDRADADAAIRAAAGGGPEYVFEAIGRPETVEQAIELLPPGGTAVLVGLTPFGARASLEVFPIVDGSRRILGSNYGFAVASVDFPRYAALHLEGRLPIDRLVDGRIGLDDLEDAFGAMRRGEHIRQVIVY